jgi:hypothetical protein
MPSPPQILRELAESAIEWRKTKAVYLAAAAAGTGSDRKATAARQVHLKAVDRLEKAVVAFEQLTFGGKARKKKAPIPWKKLLDGVAVAASALSKATNGAAPHSIDMSKVIDMRKD